MSRHIDKNKSQGMIRPVLKTLDVSLDEYLSPNCLNMTGLDHDVKTNKPELTAPY